MLRKAAPNPEQGRPHAAPIMASSPSVVQQARLMDSAGTAWHAVKCGNLEMITKLFPTQCNVYARGPVGENVMHVAMLLNTPSTLAISRYLVKLYGPQLVNCPIQERRLASDPAGTYEGQTALHIAIVNRDFDMAKFLVQNGANIRARAWGTFFRAGGPMYYGEFPLSFAACTGQKDVVAYLRRHGAQVNSDRDVFGNTALHLAVIHCQPDMYDFLVEYCAASDEVRNHAGLTPLVLAAQLGKVDMLQHIYSRRRRAFYSFGKVTSYSLALREIDTVQDVGDLGPDGGYVPNALEAALRKKHLDMLQEPLLTTLLQHKWEAFARAQFLVHFVGYLLLEVSQTCLIWLISDPVAWNGPGRASQEFVGVFLALLMLGVEVIDYYYWSRECYHRRLTMTVHKEVDPPLYPIPGEMRDARDARQGLFARISARMGFSGGGHMPGGKSESANSNVTLGASNITTAGGSGVSRPSAGGLSSNQRLSLTPPGQASSPRRFNIAAGGPAAAGISPFVARSTHPAPSSSLSASLDTRDASWRAPQQQHGSPRQQRESPRQQHVFANSSAASDDPIDLQPAFGGTVVGGGRSSQGVAVVESGMTAAGAAAAAAAGGAAARSGRPGSPLKATSMPLGEGREDPSPVPGDAAAAAAAAGTDLGQQQLQQQQPGLPRQAGSLVWQQQQLAAAAADPGRVSDDEEGGATDVVSVGLRGRGVRSSQQLAAVAAAAAAASQGARASGDGSQQQQQQMMLLSSSGGGGSSQQQQQPRVVTFSPSTRGERQSGGADSPRTSAADAAAAAVPGSSRGGPTLLHLASLGSAAAAAAAAAAATAGIGEVTPVTAHSSLDQGGSRFAGTPGDYPDQAAAGSGSGGGPFAASLAAAASPSPLSPAQQQAGSSFSGRGGPPRARSFHGLNAGIAGISTVGSSGMDGDAIGGGSTVSALLPLSASGRAATMDSLLGPSLATNSTPLSGDPLQQVQMLERQRTRARSGGGDLPAALALKRTPAPKKQPSGLPQSPPQQQQPDGSSHPAAAAAAAAGVNGGSNLGGVGSPRVLGFGEESPAGAAAAAMPGDSGSGGTAAAGIGGFGGWSGRWTGDSSGGGAGDAEKGPVSSLLDAHKTRMRALVETTYDGCVRMVEDPWLFVWHLHLVLTLIHFVVWITCYGWVGGPGPSNIQVSEFDDVIVSMMGLSGWLAVIYFFRGLRATGKLAVVLERCITDVAKFVSLYILWNLGFTLAFYTMQNGVLTVGQSDVIKNTAGINDLGANEPDPFSTIGYTMITLVNLGTGLSHYEFAMTCKNGYVLSTALCSIYYLLYLATVVLLLMNLLTAMIITTWSSTQGIAEANWKHRWAIYCLKAERRLPESWVQRLRLGQQAWDPKTQRVMYSHVFETVDDESGTDGSGSAGSSSRAEGQIRALEQLLEELRRRRPGGSSSSTGAGGSAS